MSTATVQDASGLSEAEEAEGESEGVYSPNGEGETCGVPASGWIESTSTE